MKYEEFSNYILEHLGEYRKTLSKQCGVWRRNGKETPREHILPDKPIDLRYKNFLFENAESIINEQGIPLHNYWGHLNSSQVMCINFFYPLIKEENKQILLDIIKRNIPNIPIESNMKIVEAEFEKDEPLDNTSFDFYTKITNGAKTINITWEIKYTEQGFGKTEPTKLTKDNKTTHKEKFENTYKSNFINSLNFKNSNISCEEFLNNYQINRNIFYINNDNDYAVFLTLEKNPATTEELPIIDKYKNAYHIYWEDIILNIQGQLETKLKEYADYYKEFKNKYIFWI